MIEQAGKAFFDDLLPQFANEKMDLLHENFKILAVTLQKT